MIPRAVVVLLLALVSRSAHADTVPEPLPAPVERDPHIVEEPRWVRPREPHGPPLADDAIRTVVRRERSGLTRCWERHGGGASVRLDVRIEVGASGAVLSAQASGPATNALRACLERAVARWRFPSSGAGAEATFPVVFDGG